MKLRGATLNDFYDNTERMIEMKKTKSCKLMCVLLVLSVMLGLFAGCSSGGVELTDPPGTTEPAQNGGPDATKPDTTEPSVTEPTDGTEATEPTDETEPSESDTTEPTVPANPTVPGDGTEPTVPVEPAEPDETEPAEPTLPTFSVPTEAGHYHDYKAEVVKPTCTEEGYTLYLCDCGNGFITDKVAAKGHKYGQWKTTKEPTEAAAGAAERTCSRCGSKETKVLDKLVPNHTHSYTGKVTKAATCTKDGVKTYTCSCGSSYTEVIAKTGHKFGEYKSNVDFTCMEDGTKTAVCSVCGATDTVVDYDSAMGHDHYATSVVEPTMWAEGYTIYTCYNCGNELKRDYTDKIPQEEFERKVAEAVVKYINQFRQEQGDTAATSLPGLTLVAEYRAVQLKTNFEHSITDLREAYAYYQYGEWVDATKYGDDAKYSHYTANAKEAIGKVACSGDADTIGYRLARGLKNSTGHWSYVGSSEFPYLGVGVAYDSYSWYICTLQTTTNYG